MRFLLKNLEHHPKVPYTYDSHSFHGIQTATEFLDRYERWRPRVGDEKANRRTHVVIIRQNLFVNVDPSTNLPIPPQLVDDPPINHPRSWEEQFVSIDELNDQLAKELRYSSS